MTSRVTSWLRAAVQRFNGFHWTAALSLIVLAITGAVAAGRDAETGLNGTLLVTTTALLFYAAARVSPKLAALVRPASSALIAAAGVLGAAMLISTAIQVGIEWILLMPGITWVAGLVFGIIRESRRTKPRKNRDQRKREVKQRSTPQTVQGASSPLHLRLSSLLGAMLIAMAAAAAIAAPALIVILAQVAYLGGSICLGVALFGVGKQLVLRIRERSSILPVIMSEGGRSLLLFTLYSLGAAAPYALLSFLVDTLSA